MSGSGRATGLRTQGLRAYDGGTGGPVCTSAGNEDESAALVNSHVFDAGRTRAGFGAEPHAVSALGGIGV